MANDPQTSEKPKACEKCGAQLGSKKELDAHTESFHPKK